ncbi:hypothetical protein [Clavibacter michiganensis]|uniref:hypothetical protein n=1 Tax=Clavibacter michiganensis TaxID=28447 RepID=UPI001BDFAF8C|nr:hypothetical protein [Clavibacter michiganensis]MBT1636308.1 hypothetical protein [Clavibacter michiganensis]
MGIPPGGTTATTAHRPRRSVITGALVVGLFVLSGCTGSPAEDGPAPAPATSTAAPAPESPPTDAERFASLEDFASRGYPSWQPTGRFSGTSEGLEEVAQEGTAPADIAPGSAGTIDITLPAPQDPSLDSVVMTAECTGTGTYWIRVVQEDPNRVGATCGADGRGAMGVPLDDPTAPTRLEIAVPDGSRIWLSTAYGRK